MTSSANDSVKYSPSDSKGRFIDDDGSGQNGMSNSPLGSPSGGAGGANSGGGNPNDAGGGGVQMERTVGLFSGVTIIVGSIIGSGIFISPKGVQTHAGSVGLSMIVWVVSGLFSAIGAYCYAELGTLIRRSGGDYAYILDAFGPLLGFLRLWIEAIVVRPCSATVVALTFAIYLLRPFFPECDQPDYAPQILAALCIILLTVVNCVSVKWATAVQDVFTVAKVFALILIVITGMVLLCMGRTDSFENVFEGTKYDVGKISLAFYSGLFAYNGWNYLNFIVEEIINPKRNLPLAILISMVLVTLIYVLTNIAFYAEISPDELLESPAVAVDFANRLYGPMWWIMPIFVACSTFGSANGVILTSSRLFVAGAREKHMPRVLTLIHKDRLTPVPAILFTGFLSMMYLFLSKNLYTLINYIQIVYWIAIGVAICALLYLRYSRPNDDRPIKVNLVWPIIFLLGCIFLVVLPVFSAPVDTAIGLGIMCSGIPAYLFGVKFKHLWPQWMDNALDSFTIWTQKFFLVVGEGKKDL